MEIEYLKYSQAVADYGSINQATKVMYISQPYLSHIIKEAKEEVGFELFQCIRQGCVLTKNGKKYLKHCEAILREIENLKQSSNEIQTGKSVTSISMIKFSYTAKCFNRICCWHWDLENYSCRLGKDSMVNVIDDVISGSTNVGMIHLASQELNIMRKPLSDKGLELRPLATFLPYVCLPSNRELPNGSSGTDTSELKNYGFVRYIGQFEDFIYHITAENLHLDLNSSSRIVYVSDRAKQMNLVPTGGFFTVRIPKLSGQNFLHGVASAPPMNCPEYILLRIVAKWNERFSNMEWEFIDEVTKSYRQLRMRKSRTARSELAAD